MPRIEITNMSISQAIEAPLTTKDTIDISGSLGNAEGVGSGTISSIYRRVLSYRSWTEVITISESLCFFNVSLPVGTLF